MWIHKNTFIDKPSDTCHGPNFPNNLRGPARWQQEHFYCSNEKNVPTEKNIAISFVYETFFWMQLINITNCRRVFDYDTLPFQQVSKFLYYGFKELLQRCYDQHRLRKLPDPKSRTAYEKKIEQRANSDGRDPIYIGQFFLYLMVMVPAISINELIMNSRYLTFRFSGLSQKHYKWICVIVFLNMIWSYLTTKLLVIFKKFRKKSI